VADQSLYPDGLQHQDDFECRGGNRRWRLGIARDGHVGPVIKLSDLALDRLAPWALRRKVTDLIRSHDSAWSVPDPIVQTREAGKTRPCMT